MPGHGDENVWGPFDKKGRELAEREIGDTDEDSDADIEEGPYIPQVQFREYFYDVHLIASVMLHLKGREVQTFEIVAMGGTARCYSTRLSRGVHAHK